MARSLAKEPMLFGGPVVQEAPRVINRPANRLSLEYFVREKEELSKQVEETHEALEPVQKVLEALNAELDTCEVGKIAELTKCIDETETEARRIKRRLDKLTKKLDNLDLDVYREAFRVLESGDPVSYIMDVYNRLHLGDTALGKVLLLSVINTVIENSEGLQPKLSGESGKGKTHAANAMFHLIPDMPYKYEGSLSAKSFFYNPDLVDGMIIFSDDIEMNADLENTLKRSMGSFQKNTHHATLDKDRKFKQTQLPKRITWWLTAVNTDYSDELVNRLFDVTVDESAEMDKRVADQIFANAEDGAKALPEDDEVKVCRAMLHIIKKQLFKAKIPFGRRISWNVPGDRRNPNRFIALVFGLAVLRHLQREEIDGYTIATKEDFNDAKALYGECKSSQVSKLTKAELRLVGWMVAQNKPLMINDIVNGYKKIVKDEADSPKEVTVQPYTKENGELYTYQAIKKMVVGEQFKGKKGLIDKVAMEVSESKRDATYYIREFKEFTGDAVSLKE